MVAVMMQMTLFPRLPVPPLAVEGGVNCPVGRWHQSQISDEEAKAHDPESFGLRGRAGMCESQWSNARPWPLPLPGLEWHPREERVWGCQGPALV